MQKVPIAHIHTDTARFQNRTGKYSEQSVQRIVAAYDEQLIMLNPISLWKDPDGKDWLLAGHSRVEAHKRLNIPAIYAIYFTGTEAEAIEYARNSNNLGSRETYLERVRLYREKYAQLGYHETVAYISKYEDKRSILFIMELLHLNPDGILLHTLAGLVDAQDQTMRNATESIAAMIGACRIEFADKLTHAHETEMFQFLMQDNRHKQYGKQKFIALIKRIVSKEAFGKTQPLNLAGKVHKPQAIQNYETEEGYLTEEIIMRENDVKTLHKSLMRPLPLHERRAITDLRNKAIQALDYLFAKLGKLRSSKESYEDAAAQELMYDMFNPPPLPQPKQTTQKQVANTTQRSAYTLNGVATEDATGMIPIAALKAGDRYKRKNKPTYKEWQVLMLNDDGSLVVKSGDNNVHTVRHEGSLLVYKCE